MGKQRVKLIYSQVVIFKAEGVWMRAYFAHVKETTETTVGGIFAKI